MALLERVSTLVRANLNDLIDKAEHPEKMIKQVIIDMQNQLLQVKTQVAIAIADQHLLEKKQKENEDKVAEWMRKAELAVDKKQDDLARVALERVESYRDLSDGFGQQVTDQKAQVENLKTALRQLEQKLTEAQAKADLLIAQHRRARAVGKASDAKLAIGDNSKAALVTRSLAELVRLGVAMGGHTNAFYGLSGAGDLILTCYSQRSRNHTVGRRLGHGEPLAQITASMKTVAEGIPTTRSAWECARRLSIATPIIDQVYAVLYEQKRPTVALEELLRREQKAEQL